MRDSLTETLINRHAKFDAACFILGGEIRDRTNKQTKLQTTNDISTPCLSACVDNKTKSSWWRVNERGVHETVIKARGDHHVQAGLWRYDAFCHINTPCRSTTNLNNNHALISRRTRHDMVASCTTEAEYWQLSPIITQNMMPAIPDL